MFYDIYEKSKKERIKKKIRIIADIHEKNSLVVSELASQKEIMLDIESLKIGDYLIKDIVIERKTIPDLMNSIISKRIFNQLNNMKSYDKKLLIIENQEKLFLKNYNNKIIKGFVLSMILKENIPVILSKDYQETAELIAILAKQQLNNNKEPVKHQILPKKILEKKQYILESFPGIGPVKAKKLLNRFSSLLNIFNASKEDLSVVLKDKSSDFKNLIEN